MTYRESRAASRSAEELGQNLHNRTVRLEQENKQLKAGYERLRAAAIGVVADYELAIDYFDESDISIASLLNPLKEALGDETKETSGEVK